MTSQPTTQDMLTTIVQNAILVRANQDGQSPPRGKVAVLASTIAKGILDSNVESALTSASADSATPGVPARITTWATSRGIRPVLAGKRAPRYLDSYSTS